MPFLTEYSPIIDDFDNSNQSYLLNCTILDQSNIVSPWHPRLVGMRHLWCDWSRRAFIKEDAPSLVKGLKEARHGSARARDSTFHGRVQDEHVFLAVSLVTFYSSLYEDSRRLFRCTQYERYIVRLNECVGTQYCEDT